MSIILVCNSQVKTLDKYHYKPTDYLVGIDGGAYDLIEKGYEVDLAIGDFDTTDKLEVIKKHAKKTIIYSPIKDDIDLELALKYLIKEQIIGDIYIYNALYGRLDLELTNLKLLYKYPHLNLNFIGNNEVISLMHQTFTIEKGTNFSLIPLSDVTLSIDNALYNLPKTRLSLKDTYTSSNYAKEQTTITIYEGNVILIKMHN